MRGYNAPVAAALARERKHHPDRKFVRLPDLWTQVHADLKGGLVAATDRWQTEAHERR